MKLSSGWPPRGGASLAPACVESLEGKVEREVRSWYRIFYVWSRGLCPLDEGACHRFSIPSQMTFAFC
jgi:hypothetical protein